MKKKSNKPAGRTSDALVILDRMMGEDLVLRQMAEEARGNAEMAQLIYDARTKAKLTQKELAGLVGTTPSVIAMLEDADHDGLSLAMLHRMAAALGCRVEIRFVRSPRVKEVHGGPLKKECAFVELRGTAVGRQAFLQGSTLAVWEVVSLARTYSGDAAAVAKHLGWPVVKVQAAFNYAAAYPDEISEAIAKNDAADLASLKHQLPQATEFVAGRRSNKR